MKISKVVFLIAIALGMMTLMSTTCSKTEDGDPAGCSGYVNATASGTVSENFCFDALTTFTYEPNSYVTLWARESDTDIGFDCQLSSDNGAALVPGTYNCGPGEVGFVELIFEGDNGNEFYKSKSGTLSVTQADANSFKGSFSVTCVGYYNGESINFSGSFSK